MSSKQSTNPARDRRRTTNRIKDTLRELAIQLSLLNHVVGDRLELRDVDLDCLDLISRHGPLSPSALSRRTGLHPATMTGILGRLEKAGWIARDPDPTDRRAVVIRALRDRAAEIIGLYAGMNGSMDRICAGYSPAELDLLAEFLTRVTEAGQNATDNLAAQ